MKGDRRTDEKMKTKVSIFLTRSSPVQLGYDPQPSSLRQSPADFNKSLAADALSASTSLRIVSFCSRALVFLWGITVPPLSDPGREYDTGLTNQNILFLSYKVIGSRMGM